MPHSVSLYTLLQVEGMKNRYIIPIVLICFLWECEQFHFQEKKEKSQSAVNTMNHTRRIILSLTFIAGNANIVLDANIITVVVTSVTCITIVGLILLWSLYFRRRRSCESKNVKDTVRILDLCAGADVNKCIM